MTTPVIRRTPTTPAPVPAPASPDPAGDVRQMSVEQLRDASAECAAEIRELRERLTRKQTRHQILQGELGRRRRRGSFECRFLDVAKRQLDGPTFKRLASAAREVPQ